MLNLLVTLNIMVICQIGVKKFLSELKPLVSAREKVIIVKNHYDSLSGDHATKPTPMAMIFKCISFSI